MGRRQRCAPSIAEAELEPAATLALYMPRDATDAGWAAMVQIMRLVQLGFPERVPARTGTRE
jgi:hypothetical protein